MAVKEEYKNFKGDYVFSLVAKNVEKYKKTHKNGQFFDLGVGDVKLPPPKSVLVALEKAQKEQEDKSTFCGYGDELGYSLLREKIAEHHREKGEPISPDEVFITSGAKPGLNEIMDISKFKKALILLPTYPLYLELCKLLKIDIITANENSNLDELLPLLTGKNKVDVIFICSPNNPTGKVFEIHELKKLVEYSLKNNSTLIIDGAYASFCENYPPVFSIFGSEKTVVELRSYSKSISFTGLRCGYTIIKRENQLFCGYKNYLTAKSNGVNIVAQKGALAFYDEECKIEVAKRLASYRKRGEILSKPFLKHGFQVFGGVYAPYIFVKVKNGNEFSKNLLEKMGIATTPCSSFGEKNGVRLSLLGENEEKCEKCATLIDKFLSTFKI